MIFSDSPFKLIDIVTCKVGQRLLLYKRSQVVSHPLPLQHSKTNHPSQEFISLNFYRYLYT